MEKVKLVIWDLDETFWQGTLGEGKVNPIQSNIVLLKELVDRGIMNSIVSKNDYSRAINVLEDFGVLDYFIFPKIQWGGKGPAVKSLLSECNLRPVNVVFIDDNISNLEEVRFYNNGINCVSPNYLKDNNILELEQFKGSNDFNHTRLKQYKILEERNKQQKSYSDSFDFLRDSDISISISKDCCSHIDRIYELISRTNQLNYTKSRISKNELITLLNDNDISKAYIRAKDKFGDYGIIGFYAMKNNKLIHFLFSCRVLGFYIENYIYRYLNYPILTVVGDTAVEIDNGINIDWISIGDKKTALLNNEDNKKSSLLFIGGCDVQQTTRYLESSYDIVEEFNTIINGVDVRTSLSQQIVDSIKLEDNVKIELCNNLPFFDLSKTYSTTMFSNKYNCIVYSVVDDYIRTYYKKKNNDILVGIGDYWNPDEKIKEYNLDKNLFFTGNFIRIGKLSTERFRNNLEFIMDNINSNIKVIFINGIELDVSEWIGKDRCDRNIEMNAIVDFIVSKYSNAYLVDMREIVKSKNDLSKKDNRHFTRECYYKMAIKISELCDGNIKASNKAYSILKTTVEDYQSELLNKLRNLKRGTK